MNSTMEGDAIGGWRMQLSPVDTRMLRFGLRVLFVFPPPSSSASPYDHKKLRQSFGQLLHEDIPFVKYAERFRDEENGGFCLNYRHGAQEKQCLEFEELSALTRMEEVLETTPLDFIPARPDTQVLCVKCCLLIDGALVIGVNADHCVVDAEGLTLLMKRWSHHYDDVATSTSAHLSHDRRQLIPSRPNSSTKPHPEYACACHASTQSQMHVDPVASSSSGFATSQQRFHLSPRELRDLKTFAAFGDETPPFSTLDCVTALLTWLITRCRGHRDAVQVSTALNLRRRMQPPLPDHFTGNAVLPALSRHPAQDFEASNSSPCARSLHAIARRIRESVTKFTDAYIRDTISLLAAHTVDPDALQSAARFASGPDLLFSSWRGLGMTDVDFGSRPTYVGPPALQPCDGVVIFLDQVDSQPGLDALVFLEDKTMHKLLGLWQLDVFVHTGTPPRAESRTI